MMNMSSGNAFGGIASGSNRGLDYMQGGEQNVQNNVQQTVANGVNCPNCGAVATGKFCGECGTKIEVDGPKHCTNCGKELSANAKFCGECGTKVE